MTLLLLRAQLLNRSGKDSTIFISGQVFLPNYPLSACRDPWGTAVADFTGDAWEDIVVACRGEGRITLYINDQKAEFSQRRSFSSLSDPWKPLAIDLNQDGRMDIVVASYSAHKVAWHIARGKVDLSLSGEVSVPRGPHHLFAGDWNGDKRPDVGVVCFDAGAIQLLTATPSGALQTYTKLQAPIRPRTASAADLDGDSRADIVAGGEEPLLLIFLSSQNYENPIRLSALPSVWALGIADLNKDGQLDIVIATYTGTSLATFFQHEPLRWEKAQVQASGNYNFSLHAGDFDKDGDMDVVTVSARDNVINVHLNDGRGQLSERHRIATGQWPISLTLADVNGDENVDFITTSLHDNAINVHRNIPVNPPRPVKIAIKGKIIDGDTRQEVAGNVTFIDSTALEKPGESKEALQSQRFEPGRLFQFEVAGGRHVITLKAIAPGYPPAYASFVIPSLKELPDSVLKEGIYREIVVQKVQRLRVWGYVVEAKRREPIRGASVRVAARSGEVLAEISSDEKGYYEAQIPLGLNHQIQGEAAEYEPTLRTFSLGQEHYPKGLQIDLVLQKAPPSQACLEGKVLHQGDQSPLRGVVIHIIDRQGARRRFVSQTGGTFKACLPAGAYYVEIIHKGFFPYRDSVQVPPAGTQRDFLLSPVASEKAIVLRNIYFDYDKATLRPESIEELERVVRFLQENPSLKVEISGHTDSDGSEAYNLRLSQARAQAVVDYLVSRGIATERLIARGYGESRPVAPNDTPENKQKNRRTELKILEM